MAAVPHREATLTYWLKNAAYLTGLPGYAAAVRLAGVRAKTPNDWLAVTKRLRLRGYSLRAHQVDEEILGLIGELRERKVERVVEIGTARGGTLFLLLRSLSPTGRFVSVDLPSGPFGGGYPHWKALLFRSLARRGQSLSLLRGDSHLEETRERVSRALDGPADFILIDGDHSYEGAKRDFELYRHLLGERGFLAFHDIVPGATEKVGGVPQLWQELKAQFEHREIVKSWDQRGYGIGVLYPRGRP
ncbi:MAG: class I SAM-dependent methyltransferase [Myxococcales bacterium]|nr:MAG: class I SAM-dependent methyltransferase [Myxococcales bacterium]